MQQQTAEGLGTSSRRQCIYETLKQLTEKSVIACRPIHALVTHKISMQFQRIDHWASHAASTVGQLFCYTDVDCVILCWQFGPSNTNVQMPPAIDAPEL